MILDRGVISGQHFRGEPALERVRAERAEDDRRGKRERGDEQAESGVHPEIHATPAGACVPVIRTYEGNRYSSTMGRQFI